MSDSLCGPSNALQNFQKQSSVDRTLQQDRLVSRQFPSQAFRSQDATAGTLDPEFEAFQAGQTPAFAGPAFHNHHSFPLQPSPFYAAPPAASSATPSWTQDFQQLNLSQPQQPQQIPQAWHGHFQQNGKSQFYSPPAHMQPSAAQFRPSPTFGSMQFRPQTHHHMFETQQARQPQASQDQFDEAAFEAAFDAAMADVNTAQDNVMLDSHSANPPSAEGRIRTDVYNPYKLEQELNKVDIYPHLPLFRLVLAHALVANTDESLHRAAKVVDLLTKHSRIDPAQSMLLRPLLQALNDPKRTVFSERYGNRSVLHEMLVGYNLSEQDARIEIDQTNEQLLAAYADLLWQRNHSNHLQPTDEPRSTDNMAWLDKFYTSQDWSQEFDGTNVTNLSVRLLKEDFKGQLVPNLESPQFQPLNRVLELELDAYSKKVTLAESTKSLDSNQNEAILFNMMDTVLAAPETIEALENVQQQAEEYARQIYVRSELELLQRQNRKQLGLNTMREPLMMEQQNMAQLDMSRQNAVEMDEERMFTHDPNHHQFEEQLSRQLSPGQYQYGLQSSQQQSHSQQQDEELARTAADLLDRVADNKTSKFQNSAFLGLMRQLADRQVRVEGDKMVSTTMPAGSGIEHATSSTADAGQPTISSQDGQEVVDILRQDQDPEFMMTSPFTSPFASSDDY